MIIEQWNTLNSAYPVGIVCETAFLRYYPVKGATIVKRQ